MDENGIYTKHILYLQYKPLYKKKLKTESTQTCSNILYSPKLAGIELSMEFCLYWRPCFSCVFLSHFPFFWALSHFENSQFPWNRNATSKMCQKNAVLICVFSVIFFCRVAFGEMRQNRMRFRKKKRKGNEASAFQQCNFFFFKS